MKHVPGDGSHALFRDQYDEVTVSHKLRLDVIGGQRGVVGQIHASRQGVVRGHRQKDRLAVDEVVGKRHGGHAVGGIDDIHRPGLQLVKQQPVVPLPDLHLDLRVTEPSQSLFLSIKPVSAELPVGNGWKES